MKTYYTTQTLSNNDDLFTQIDVSVGELSQYDLIVFLYTPSLDAWNVYQTYDIADLRNAITTVLFDADVVLRLNPKFDALYPDDKYERTKAEKIIDRITDLMFDWEYDHPNKSWED